MKYAIIAAGNGSRLAKRGHNSAKAIGTNQWRNPYRPPHTGVLQQQCNRNSGGLQRRNDRRSNASRPHTATQTERQEHHIALYSKIDTQFYAQL